MPRFVSFNINGLRARPHQLEAIRDIFDPDVIGLQETKVQDEAFPLAMVQDLGYRHVAYFGQKSHYGVALLSKTAPLLVQKGFLHDTPDCQRRLIHARYEFGGKPIDVLNGYFPQGENQDHPTKFPMKRDFYHHLTHYIHDLRQAGNSLIVMGDMNIAPNDTDVGIGEKNAQRWLKNGVCSFLPEEREWYANLLATDLQDTYRVLYPDGDALSWFDYRSKGFEDDPKRGLRIDHILMSPDLREKLNDAGISYALRGMEKPSDHAPIWADFAD